MNQLMFKNCVPFWDPNNVQKGECKSFVSNDLWVIFNIFEHKSLETNLLHSSFVNIIVIPKMYTVFKH